MNLQSSDAFYTNGNIIPVFDHYKNLYNNTSKFCEKLDLTYEDVMVLQKQISLLREKWQVIPNYTFSDLDDTLLSRYPQLEEDKFAMARWPAGNEVVKSMWLKQFIKQYYSPDLVVNKISNITDIILTAWEVENQEAKIQEAELTHLDAIIVPKHELKPRELLYFLLFKLQKLPLTISFFDDKADKLKDQFTVISEFLNNSIISHKVELDPDFPNQVKNIDTKIFSSWVETSSH